MDGIVTFTELMDITGIPKRTLFRRLKSLGIKPVGRETNGGGRPTNLYDEKLFPDDWQLKINLHRQKKSIEDLKAQQVEVQKRGRPSKAASESGLPVCVRADGTAIVPWKPGDDGGGLNLKEQELCHLKGTFISNYRAFYTAHADEWGKTVPAKQAFLEAYNLGDRGSYPVLYAKIGNVSFKTAEAWDLRLRRNGNNSFCLADRRGKWRKGLSKVSPEQARILRDMALMPTQPLMSEIIRKARSRFQVAGLPWSKQEISDDTMRRWLEEFKVKHYDQWVFFREGEKALNDKCLPHIDRDYDAIEVGDVAVADGHVLNCRLINPWTGKLQRMVLVPWYDMKSNYVLGWELMPSENVHAYASGLYRACLCLGKVPKVAYLDNSRAARAGYFRKTTNLEESPLAGVWQRLGMGAIYAKVRHGESKTVERFFGTLAEMERAAVFAYIGTSIEKKPAYMLRGESIHKALRDVITGGREPGIEDFHWALAAWLDDYHERPQSGHLKGRCPREVFEAGRGPGFSAEEAQNLRFLMMPLEIRKVNQNGIKLPWSDTRYYHPDLYGRQLQDVVIRYDWIDKDQIWVYDKEGNFICEATRKPRVHPAARLLGTEQDVAVLSEQTEMQGHLKKQTVGPAREFLKEHMIPEIRKQLEESGLKPVDGAEANGSGGKGLRLVKGPSGKPQLELPRMTEEEKRRIDEEVERRLAEAEAERAADVVDVDFLEVEPQESEVVREPTLLERLPKMLDRDRYEALIEMGCRGEEVPSGELAWMSMYERMPEYRTLDDYFEEYRVKMMLFYEDGKGAKDVEVLGEVD